MEDFEERFIPVGMEGYEKRFIPVGVPMYRDGELPIRSTGFIADTRIIGRELLVVYEGCTWSIMVKDYIDISLYWEAKTRSSAENHS